MKISGKKAVITYTKAQKIGKKITVKATNGSNTISDSITVKGTLKISGVKAKKNKKKVTGKTNVKKATVKVRVKYKGKK